jgi:exosortase/archaeosortase
VTTKIIFIEKVLQNQYLAFILQNVDIDLGVIMALSSCYKTSDTLLVAYIIYNGIKPIDTELTSGTVIFVFQNDNPKLEKIIDNFSQQVKIILPAFFVVYRDLIDKIQQIKREQKNN